MRARPQLHITDDVAGVAARLMRQAIEAACAAGRCRLGLSGGSTPGPIMEQLGASLAPGIYKDLTITWVDERHPEASNQALAAEAWLDRVTPVPRVIPMVTGGTLVEDTALYCKRFIHDLEGGLDVALLGVGPDGHIASLFPQMEGLDAIPPVISVSYSPKPPPSRISLTLPVLNACPVVVLAARGTSKADALRRAWDGDWELPLGRLSPTGTYHWILDPAAAGKLEQT
jgi:6-phosphogluconolactonase